MKKLRYKILWNLPKVLGSGAGIERQVWLKPEPVTLTTQTTCSLNFSLAGWASDVGRGRPTQQPSSAPTVLHLCCVTVWLEIRPDFSLGALQEPDAQTVYLPSSLWNFSCKVVLSFVFLLSSIYLWNSFSLPVTIQWDYIKRWSWKGKLPSSNIISTLIIIVKICLMVR